MPLEWTTTVAGAVLCVAYGWWLAAIARDKIVWIGRAAPLISAVGTVILAGMALSGHTDAVETGGGLVVNFTAPERVVTGAVPEDKIRFEDMLLVTRQAIREVGPKPSKSYFAYKDANGKFSWVTREDYRLLASEEQPIGGD